MYIALVLSAITEATAQSLQIGTAAGAIACQNLTSILGPIKVENNHLALDYLQTQNTYWNTKQSQYSPACIVYPESSQDVSISLKAIKAAGSRFSIKAGGHNPNTYFSSVDQGVLIDLRRMTARSYDSDTTLATYQPGGTFGDIYNYFIQFNRTVVGARLAGVGTGLALGGGLSYLSGQYGMAADGFRELEVVLPNGQIVTASKKENQDLFFACRGGGGNAYGVVTRYTVKSRPVGIFTSGNLFYILDQNKDVLEALGNFTLYNQDPKAAVIGSYELQSLPTPGLGLDSFIILFLVYDGPDPGQVFTNFTRLNPIINTISHKTYIETVNLPTPGTAEASRAANIFRVAVQRISETDLSYVKVFDVFREWCRQNKGSYVISSIDLQPIAKSLTDASEAQGGNAMRMPPGPWLWFNYLLTTPAGMPDAAYNAIQSSFRDMVNSVPNAQGLPLFLNDADYDQNPLKTFSSYRRLQLIKEKYDPDQFFANYTGGWSFTN